MNRNKLEELGIGTLLLMLVYTYIMPFAGLAIMTFAGGRITLAIAGLVMFIGGFVVWMVQGVNLGKLVEKKAL